MWQNITLGNRNFTKLKGEIEGLECNGKKMIINSVPTSEEGKKDLNRWKQKIAEEIEKVKQEIDKGNKQNNCYYAIKLILYFNLAYHGNQKLDMDNFIKPIIDGIFAGLRGKSQNGTFNFSSNDDKLYFLLVLKVDDNVTDDKIAYQIYRFDNKSDIYDSAVLNLF